MTPQNHKTKRTNIFIQAYKNLIQEWQQKRTTLTIILYHVALIGLFMPTKTFQEFHDCQGRCTANTLYMIFLMISFMVGSHILMTYIEQLTILLKDSVLSQKSIATLFVKNAERHVEINIATIILLSTIIFIIIGFYITIFPITLSLVVAGITIMLMGF
jgi:hypothetical protein